MVDGKYHVPESEDYEPGSNNKVLKNYLGIKSLQEIEYLENQELERVLAEFEELFTREHQFSSEDICALHEDWLGDIYPMAGVYRTVNMSKDDFTFAISMQIPKLMNEFEANYLKKYTPCIFSNTDKVIEALAITHVEFILIHPFREGNGRIGRLLAMLMANQAGLPPLNFDPINQNINMAGFKQYIDAIQKGIECDYTSMKDIFKNVVITSQRTT